MAGCIQNERQTVVLQVKDCRLTNVHLYSLKCCATPTLVCAGYRVLLLPLASPQSPLLLSCTSQGRAQQPSHSPGPTKGISFAIISFLARYHLTAYVCNKLQTTIVFFGWSYVSNSGVPVHLQFTSNGSGINSEIQKTKGMHVADCLDRN